MLMSSFLVDTDPNIFVYGRFSLQSDIHRFIIYAHHRKYLNIANVPKHVSLRQFPLHLDPVFKNVRRDIFGLYTFIMYIC